VAFRYQYIASVNRYTQVRAGEQPQNMGSLTFNCDYQPNVNNLSINTAGTEIPVSFQLFVPKSEDISSVKKGDDITCNGDKGVIALIVPNKFNNIIYVK